MTNSGQLKVLSDVLELIKTLNLPRDYADQLNSYVTERYRDLWGKARKRYVRILRHTSTHDSSAINREIATNLEQMIREGLILEEPGSATGEPVRLVTTDPIVAEKYGH